MNADGEPCRKYRIHPIYREDGVWLVVCGWVPVKMDGAEPGQTLEGFGHPCKRLESMNQDRCRRSSAGNETSENRINETGDMIEMANGGDEFHAVFHRLGRDPYAVGRNWRSLDKTMVAHMRNEDHLGHDTHRSA
ncbi:MAG: hypothetical protein WAO07_13860 [Desulfobacterales bacterium]